MYLTTICKEIVKWYSKYGVKFVIRQLGEMCIRWLCVEIGVWLSTNQESEKHPPKSERKSRMLKSMISTITLKGNIGRDLLSSIEIMCVYL